MAGQSTSYPVLHFEQAPGWSAWLEANHATAAGAWLRLARKGAALTSVTRDEALDAALCYGWIDGQARRHDEESWLQKYTPRGRRSIWSKRNRERVERLIDTGLMQPAGLAAIEAARRDGRWQRAYDSPATASVPPDLQAALEQRPAARELFESLTGRNRYAILNRIQTAVKEETRTRRILKFVEMLERGETIYP